MNNLGIKKIKHIALNNSVVDMGGGFPAGIIAPIDPLSLFQV